MTASEVGYQRVREWGRAMLDSMHAMVGEEGAEGLTPAVQFYALAV